MAVWQFNKIQLWENFFHLWPDELVNAIVIRDMQESACQQVDAEVRIIVIEEQIAALK
jgi:hypothetical protein